MVLRHDLWRYVSYVMIIELHIFFHMSNDSLITQNNCVNFAGSHLCCGFFVAVRGNISFIYCYQRQMLVSILNEQLRQIIKLKTLLTHLEQPAAGFTVRRPGNKETGGVRFCAQKNAIWFRIVQHRRLRWALLTQDLLKHHQVIRVFGSELSFFQLRNHRA